MTHLSRLKDLKKRLDAHKPFSQEIITNLDEWYKIELTYTSNAIEGNTLTRQETALVVEKGLTVEGKSIVEHLEAINHAKAWDYILLHQGESIQQVSERTILDIHSHILHNIDNLNAGVYRRVPVRIAGSSVVMPNPLKVSPMMKDFIAWLHASEGDIVDIAIQAHYKLVSIHPFTDGNGRTGRLLMNLILMQGGYPPAIIQKEERKEYISSIEKGQLHDDLSDYIPFMYKTVERSLLIYLDALEPQAIPDIHEEGKLLKIGDLAKATDESVPTIRFWTQEGLLQVTEYTPGGYQLYSPDMIKRVKKIRNLQLEKRLTIEELKKVMV